MPGVKGRSGRRPLPTAVKELRGNPSRRDLNEQEPQADRGRPEIPPGLSEVAKAEWESIVPKLEQLGVLSRIDGKALAAYCHAFARWWEAEKQVEHYGLLLEEPILNSEGEEVGTRVKKNPAVGISRDAMRCEI
jgi:P27 family predicted phage terminase small subunit